MSSDTPTTALLPCPRPGDKRHATHEEARPPLGQEICVVAVILEMQPFAMPRVASRPPKRPHQVVVHSDVQGFFEGTKRNPTYDSIVTLIFEIRS